MTNADKSLRLLRGAIEETDHSRKNFQILQLAVDVSRSLHGGRITCCKSGKDRTAMSATLEMGQVYINNNNKAITTTMTIPSAFANLSVAPVQIIQQHSPSVDSGQVVRALREHGLRRHNCHKNVGQPTFAFNAIQRKLLPKQYRPPLNTISGLLPT